MGARQRRAALLARRLELQVLVGHSVCAALLRRPALAVFFPKPPFLALAAPLFGAQRAAEARVRVVQAVQPLLRHATRVRVDAEEMTS